MALMMSQLKIEQLEVRLGTHTRLVLASSMLTFDVNRPLIFIRGDNGTGKTTFLNLLCSYLRPVRGFASLDGVQISNRGPRWARKHGIVRGFQSPLLCNELTVWENVALPGWNRWWLNPRRVHESIIKRLKEIGLGKYADASPAELSFGQRRIVEMARIEMQLQQHNPRLLLLDEPLAGLDPLRRRKATDMIYNILKAGIATIIVEHDTHLDALAGLAAEVELVKTDTLSKLQYLSQPSG